MPPTENNSTVVLPNYLQAFASDCSHLSFGTYKSGAASASPQPVASNPLKSNLEVSAAEDGSSAGHLNIRRDFFSSLFSVYNSLVMVSHEICFPFCAEIQDTLLMNILVFCMIIQQLQMSGTMTYLYLLRQRLRCKMLLKQHVDIPIFPRCQCQIPASRTFNNRVLSHLL